MSTKKIYRDINSTFCENLRIFLELNDLNQADLARMLKVSRTQVGKILDPTTSKTLDTVSKIAIALELPPHFFLYLHFDERDFDQYVNLEGETDIDSLNGILDTLKEVRDSKDLINLMKQKKKPKSVGKL